jgi:2-polyprenyl-3-methyl-5-hydroxy-6-metoxy-1,4-benzoquinol methylase
MQDSPDHRPDGVMRTPDGAGPVPIQDRWNHNIHYHPVVLDALPPDCERVLDVGCGEGLLALP